MSQIPRQWDIVTQTPNLNINALNYKHTQSLSAKLNLIFHFVFFCSLLKILITQNTWYWLKAKPVYHTRQIPTTTMSFCQRTAISTHNNKTFQRTVDMVKEWTAFLIGPHPNHQVSGLIAWKCVIGVRAMHIHLAEELTSD